MTKVTEEAPEVSHKKMATESKKNKALETDSKHPKTEEKLIPKSDEPEIEMNFNKASNEAPPALDSVEQEPQHERGVLADIKSIVQKTK